VVLNPNTASERGRLNAAHELGHILYGDCDHETNDDEKVETRVFEFASSLLISDEDLRYAFTGKSVVRLVTYKELFGISLQAMIYRAQRARIIPESEAKWLWIEFAKRGWRTKEPGYVRKERATRFEQLLEGALAENKLTMREAATLMAV